MRSPWILQFPVDRWGSVVYYVESLLKFNREAKIMQPDIHPAYAPIQVTCSCGNEFSVGSTLNHALHVDVCNRCHPFYTGQKREAVSGQIEKFRNRFKQVSSAQ